MGMKSLSPRTEVRQPSRLVQLILLTPRLACPQTKRAPGCRWFGHQWQLKGILCFLNEMASGGVIDEPQGQPSGLDRPKSAGTSGQAKADLRSSMVQRFRAKPSKADAIRRTWFQTNPSASIENLECYQMYRAKAHNARLV